MQVRETSLSELIGGSKQFRVPLFQRPYTWEEANLAQLWRDLVSLYDQWRDSAEDSPADLSPHFLGSFVLAPYPAAASAVTSFVVVDGQQRLITLLVALCALRDTSSLEDPDARDRINETYLVNKWSEGESRHRLVPSKPDRPAFEAIVDDQPTKGASDRIGDAYRYFVARVSEGDANGDPLDLSVIERIIATKLAIVDITAQAGDNVHRIFESLNATGVGLTQADLLRNYLMMLLPTRADAVYEEVWLPMQQQLGADNLEGLARVDLQSRGLHVRSDSVYRMQQKRLQPMEHSEAAVEEEIRALAVRASHYGTILNPDREQDPGVRDRLTFLDRWGAQTAHPLIVYLFELRDQGSLSAEAMETALGYLESFLVRRLLTGASRRNLNRIFPTIARRMRERSSSEALPERLRMELSGERLYWASDGRVRKGVKTEPFYFYGRGQQRRMILERIEESFGHKELARLADLNLSVEHIMPQTLSDEWRSELEQAGENAEDVHSELKHTLGNLTLSAYNSELSNNPFERKKQIYEESHLSLNAALKSYGLWGRQQILGRAEELSEIIIRIWPPPLEVAPEREDGPDWNRLHAAIAAIPPGWWTTYGDLAEVIGSGAQAVGTHIGANLHILNAHRVLTRTGEPAGHFRWPDPLDSRDVREVLASEGLTFDESGAADSESRLSAEELVDLAGLSEEIEEDDGDGLGEEWPDQLIVRCYKESPPAMVLFLEYLAEHPDRTMTSAQILASIDRSPRQLGGILGSFGNRTRHRYGMESWPFEAEWSDEAGLMIYRMPSHVSDVIRSARG